MTCDTACDTWHLLPNVWAAALSKPTLLGPWFGRAEGLLGASRRDSCGNGRLDVLPAHEASAPNPARVLVERATGEAVPRGVQAGPDPVRDPDLGIDVLNVIAHGLLGNPKGRGDLPVG
jgi:hypothetical protein